MSKDNVEKMLSDQNRALLARLGESTRHAVVMTSCDGVIRYWNRGAEAIYRLLATETIGRRLADLTPDDLLTMRLHAATITTMSGEAWSGELQFVRGDGCLAWVSIAASPMHSPGGQVIGTVWLGWDVSERKLRAYLQNLETLAVPVGVEHVPC